jgi:hypothetical protein
MFFSASDRFPALRVIHPVGGSDGAPVMKILALSMIVYAAAVLFGPAPISQTQAQMAPTAAAPR